MFHTWIGPIFSSITWVFGILYCQIWASWSVCYQTNTSSVTCKMEATKISGFELYYTEMSQIKMRGGVWLVGWTVQLHCTELPDCTTVQSYCTTGQQYLAVTYCINGYDSRISCWSKVDEETAEIQARTSTTTGHCQGTITLSIMQIEETKNVQVSGRLDPRQWEMPQPDAGSTIR